MTKSVFTILLTMYGKRRQTIEKEDCRVLKAGVLGGCTWNKAGVTSTQFLREE